MMIRKVISWLLIVSLLLVGCRKTTQAVINDDVEFNGLNDAKLMQYVQDEVYSDLEASLDERYTISDINMVYVSKEYIDQLEFNSQKNIYFGYTLQEVLDSFGDEKYVFSVDEHGKTIVKKFEKYDDTYDVALKNIAIGSGVILICVTVSVATGGAAPAVSAVFAASAKTGTAFAMSSGVISGGIAGVVNGIQTGNVDSALKAAASAGSESFKWGAIIGSVAGGADKALSIYKSSKVVPTPREAELNALKQYGGREQVSYFNRTEVVGELPQGCTRPDIVRQVGDHLEAIEVKTYNLESHASLNNLYKVLEKQVTSRVNNMPLGTTQRIVLNTQGRGYSTQYVEMIIKNIKSVCESVYHDIPVDIMKYVIN